MVNVEAGEKLGIRGIVYHNLEQVKTELERMTS